MNPSHADVTISRCSGCGQLWIQLDLEDWVARSNRWYRAPISKIPKLEDARQVIDSASHCYSGGEYHRPHDETGEPLFLADGTQRWVGGFRMNEPPFIM